MSSETLGDQIARDFSDNKAHLTDAEQRRLAAMIDKGAPMPDSPRDPAAEAKRLLSGLEITAMEASFDRHKPAMASVRREDLLALALELVGLRALKAYVHQRLDEAGIATHPDGPHSREGCRVGDRLDIITRELVERRDEYRKLALALCEAMTVVDEVYVATGFIKVAKTSEQRMRIEAACASLPAPPAEEKPRGEKT